MNSGESKCRDCSATDGLQSCLSVKQAKNARRAGAVQQTWLTGEQSDCKMNK
jgi:hypothetical protein